MVELRAAHWLTHPSCHSCCLSHAYWWHLEDFVLKQLCLKGDGIELMSSHAMHTNIEGTFSNVRLCLHDAPGTHSSPVWPKQWVAGFWPFFSLSVFKSCYLTVCHDIRNSTLAAGSQGLKGTKRYGKWFTMFANYAPFVTRHILTQVKLTE